MKTSTIFMGLSLSIIPGITIGAIVIWLAAEIKPFNQAVFAGVVVCLLVMWIGAWLAGLVANAD